MERFGQYSIADIRDTAQVIAAQMAQRHNPDQGRRFYKGVNAFLDALKQPPESKVLGIVAEYALERVGPAFARGADLFNDDPIILGFWSSAPGMWTQEAARTLIPCFSEVIIDPNLRADLVAQIVAGTTGKKGLSGQVDLNLAVGAQRTQLEEASYQPELVSQPSNIKIEVVDSNNIFEAVSAQIRFGWKTPKEIDSRFKDARFNPRNEISGLLKEETFCLTRKAVERAKERYFYQFRTFLILNELYSTDDILRARDRTEGNVAAGAEVSRVDLRPTMPIYIINSVSSKLEIGGEIGRDGVRQLLLRGLPASYKPGNDEGFELLGPLTFADQIKEHGMFVGAIINAWFPGKNHRLIWEAA